MSHDFNSPFTQDERKALDWFRRQYWSGDTPVQVPDEAIAYMLLRVALGHPERLAAWMDEVIHYRDAEGVSLSELIDRKIAQPSEYQDGTV